MHIREIVDWGNHQYWDVIKKCLHHHLKQQFATSLRCCSRLARDDGRWLVSLTMQLKQVEPMMARTCGGKSSQWMVPTRFALCRKWLSRMLRRRALWHPDAESRRCATGAGHAHSPRPEGRAAMHVRAGTEHVPCGPLESWVVAGEEDSDVRCVGGLQRTPPHNKAPAGSACHGPFPTVLLHGRPVGPQYATRGSRVRRVCVCVAARRWGGWQGSVVCVCVFLIHNLDEVQNLHFPMGVTECACVCVCVCLCHLLDGGGACRQVPADMQEGV